MILLALLTGGGFALIDGVARGMVQAELLVSLLFFALLFWYVSRERFKHWSTRRPILLTSALRA